jgi:drug/metabolite transporter (DMT)-like permease
VPPKYNIQPKAILLLVLITFAFGSGWPIMKYGVVELPVLTFRWLTAILSGFGVLTLAVLLGHRLRLHRKEIGIAFVCGLFNVTGWFYFSGLGLTMLSAGRSTILAYTHPLFAFLIALAIGHDRLSPRRVFGLTCGMGAVAALLERDFSTFGDLQYGVLAMLAAAACFATGANLQKRAWRTPSTVLAGWQLLLGGLPLLVLALLFDTNPFVNFTILGIGAVAYTVFIGNMIGFVLWLKLLELIPAPIATLCLLPVPMIGITSGVIILGESFGWREAAALALITMALASTMTLPSLVALKKR